MINKIIIFFIVFLVIGVVIFYSSYYKKRTKEVLKTNIENFVKSREIERVVEWQSDQEVLVILYVNMSFEGFLKDLQRFFKAQFKVYKDGKQIIVEGGLGVKLKINIEFEKPNSLIYFVLNTKNVPVDDIFKFLNLPIPLNILVENNEQEYVKRLEIILNKHGKDFVILHEIPEIFTELDSNDDILEISKNISSVLKKAKDENKFFVLGNMKSENLAFMLNENLIVFNKDRIKFEKVKNENSSN